MITLIIALAMFMEALDSNVINTAIPAMASNFAVNPLDLKLALISYLLSLAIFIPISGWVADKFGIKRVFISALAIFTLSSLWCGFAHHVSELVIARIFQGLGGAFTLPVGRLIIVRTFPRQEYITAMNRVVTVGALGIMSGPVLGGVITHHLSWHWIFFINIPIGLFAILMAKYFLRIPSDKKQKIPPLDKWGFLLFGSSLATFTFGLSAFSETYIRGQFAILILVVALLLFFSYLLHSRRQPYPIVNPKLLQQRTFCIATLGNLFSRLGSGAAPFIVPLLLQVILGFSAQASGLLWAPCAVGILLAKRVALFMLRKEGYKKFLISNTVLLGLSLASFALINAHSPLYLIPLLTLIFGFLVSLQNTSMNSLAYADIATENLSATTSISSTLQQLAQSFGVAMSALWIRLFAPVTLTMRAFHLTFLIMGLVTVLSVIIFFNLKPDDGSQMIA